MWTTRTVKIGTREAKNPTDNNPINIFLMSKPNYQICQGLDSMGLKPVLIRPAQRGLTINDMLPKLKPACNMTLIDMSSGYHDLELEKNLSYPTTLDASLAGTNSQDCQSELCQQVVCSIKINEYSLVYQMYFIFW